LGRRPARSRLHSRAPEGARDPHSQPCSPVCGKMPASPETKSSRTWNPPASKPYALCRKPYQTPLLRRTAQYATGLPNRRQFGQHGDHHAGHFWFGGLPRPFRGYDYLHGRNHPRISEKVVLGLIKRSELLGELRLALKRIEIIPIARKKLHQRGIPESWVLETITAPDQIADGYGNRSVAQKKYSVRGKDYLFRVVFEDKSDCFLG